MTKEEILGIDDKVIQTLQIPEWKDQWVCMKGMTGSERDSWEADVYVSRKKNELEGMLDFRARLVAKCLCDREGKLLFSAKEIKALSAKSAKVLDRLFDLAQTMNGMKKEDLEKMTENLPEGQTAD
jgi:hypothetical protein